MIPNPIKRPLQALALALALLTLPTVACNKGTTVAPIHQGAANAFDSTTYDALVTLQAGIEQAKTGVPTAQKPLLNNIIKGYNTAKAAYLVYHQAATAGTATPQAQADLAAQIAALQSQLATLKGAPK